jgi:hypothetical protein
VALSSPLSVSSLGILIKIPEQRANRTLRALHAILNIPKDHSRPLRLHHPPSRGLFLIRDDGRVLRDGRVEVVQVLRSLILISRSQGDYS